MRKRKPKTIGKLLTAVTSVGVYYENHDDAYTKTQQCLLHLSSGRVKPVPLLNDRFTSLPDDELRQGNFGNSISTSDGENTWTFQNSIVPTNIITTTSYHEERFKIMKEENRQRFNDLQEENEKRYNRLQEQNRDLKKRFTARDKLQQQQPNDTVKVDGVRLGATVFVLYVMARECVDRNGVETNLSIDRSATRRQRDKYAANFRWEWWARIAMLSFFLQMAMIAILHVSNAVLARESGVHSIYKLPRWQVGVACVVFSYDSIRTSVPTLARGFYCYWRMETLELFQKHKFPKRTRILALWLAGWDMLIFWAIVLNGIVLLQLSQTPLDLILNVVALHFIYEIDDYVMNLVPVFGLLKDIDAPKSVVLPTYVTEPQWRDNFFFFWIAKILRFLILDAFIIPMAIFGAGIATLHLTHGFFVEDPSQVADIYAERWAVWYVDVFPLPWMAIPSVMPILQHCCLKSNARISRLGNFVKYLKIGCFLLVYFAVITSLSVTLTAFVTKYFALLSWPPPVVSVGFSWSIFMALVVLLIH